MDWFERLTGFIEEDYVSTRAKLTVSGEQLISLVNGKIYSMVISSWRRCPTFEIK